MRGFRGWKGKSLFPHFRFFSRSLQHFSHLFASIFLRSRLAFRLSPNVASRLRGCFAFQTNLHQLSSSWLFTSRLIFSLLIHFCLSFFCSSTFSKSEKFLWHRDGHTTLPRNDNDKLRSDEKKLFFLQPAYTLSHRPRRGFFSFSRARESGYVECGKANVRCIPSIWKDVCSWNSSAVGKTGRNLVDPFSAHHSRSILRRRKNPISFNDVRAKMIN